MPPHELSCAVPCTRGPREYRLIVQIPPHLNPQLTRRLDRKSTRLNSSHVAISYAVFCSKKKNVVPALPPTAYSNPSTTPTPTRLRAVDNDAQLVHLFEAGSYLI